MKTKFRFLIFMIILALAVPTTPMAVYDGIDTQQIGRSELNFAEPTPTSPPYDPETVPVPDPLLEKYAGFFPPAVIKVTDGVYVARGYNRDNPVLIEGVNGLIVVDPGESIPASQIVKDALNAQLDNIFDKKPVKAIIYTHGHDCHIHGAAVFANEHTEIIAQEVLMSGLFMDLVVGLQLTDAGKNKPNPAYYTLDIRKGFLEVNPPSASNAQFVIVADTLTWKEVVLSKLTPEDVVANGKMVISGGTPASFNSFMDLFE